MNTDGANFVDFEGQEKKSTSSGSSVTNSGQTMNCCQAQPKPKFSLAELAIKSHSDHQQQCNNNRGSIKQAEYQLQTLFKGPRPRRFDPPSSLTH